MKVHVLYDAKGRIVSAGFIDLPYGIEDDVPFSFGPVAEDREATAELDIPDEYVRRPLTDDTLVEFVERLQADPHVK